MSAISGYKIYESLVQNATKVNKKNQKHRGKTNGPYQQNCICDFDIIQQFNKQKGKYVTYILDTVFFPISHVFKSVK